MPELSHKLKLSFQCPGQTKLIDHHTFPPESIIDRPQNPLQNNASGSSSNQLELALEINIF